MAPVRHPVEPPADHGGRSDQDLLAAHLAGDADAFAHLVRRHQDRLWSVALRTLRDPDEAHDAVQDALINAYRRAASFRGEAQVSTWLHRIVVNACLDRIRRRRPGGELPDEEQLDRTATADPFEQSDQRLAIQQALDGLPQAQRLAVVLVDVEQLSVREVAELLGVAEGTVKSRCARGRAALAQSLRGFLTDAEPSSPPPRPTDQQGGDPIG